MTPEQTQEIIQWRDRRLSPKEIARQMGLRPADVTVVLREYAEQNPTPKVLPPLGGCLINRSGQQRLLQNVPGLAKSAYGGNEGLCEVIVLRIDNHRYLTSAFLIDYWCLGVKDAFLKKGDRHQYETLMEKVQRTFDEDFVDITLEQAQSIVFGAIDYAASLGFQPHPDFEKAKVNLGPRLENLTPITCGRDGKPFYFCGPHDNQAKILQTLQTHVGKGNFEFVAAPRGF